MYIESSEKVKELFCDYEDLKLEEKISSLIYIFNSFGNNQINNLKNNLEKCINDKQCFSDIFNSLVDKIIVYKENSANKKIKLDILFKTGESINTYSDNSGKKFHLLDSVTTKSLINDTLIINRGSISKYTKKYDVEYEFRCLVHI